jgi:hypothetical protein
MIQASTHSDKTNRYRYSFVLIITKKLLFSRFSRPRIIHFVEHLFINKCPKTAKSVWIKEPENLNPPMQTDLVFII